MKQQRERGRSSWQKKYLKNNDNNNNDDEVKTHHFFNKWLEFQNKVQTVLNQQYRVWVRV